MTSEAFAITPTMAAVASTGDGRNTNPMVVVLSFGGSVSISGYQQLVTLREAIDYALQGEKTRSVLDTQGMLKREGQAPVAIEDMEP